MDANVLTALTFSLLAGLSTGIGGLVVFFGKLKNTNFLAFSMAFAAGVMLYVSFVEMLPHSFEGLQEVYSEFQGKLMAVLLFFAGMALVFTIDKLIPSHEHEPIQTNSSKTPEIQKKSLFKTGLMVALALAIHNFPEGIATFTSAMEDVKLGAIIAFAIAIHNIPEGIAVAAPIYYATGSKKKAFGFAFLSGLAEPLGALLAYWLLGDLIGTTFFGHIMSFIAGIMVYISIDFLIPSALQYGKKQVMLNGLVLGMFIMAISLILE
jgi:zinc transporter, ZIP family